LVIEVAHEETHAGEQDDREKDDRPEDQAPVHDGAIGLERSALWRFGLPALALVERDQLIGLKVEVFGVVAQEPLRVHRARKRLVVAVLERFEELLADPRVRSGLLEGDVLLLALGPKHLAELRHRRAPSRTPRASCPAPATVR